MCVYVMFYTLKVFHLYYWGNFHSGVWWQISVQMQKAPPLDSVVVKETFQKFNQFALIKFNFNKNDGSLGSLFSSLQLIGRKKGLKLIYLKILHHPYQHISRQHK